MNERGLHHAAPSLAVAVSGGADSLCLALTAHEWAKRHSSQAIAFTVDHGLRSNSSDEAHQVKDWLEAHGIEHHILTWEGDKPSTALQEEARNARYNLLLNACHENQLNHLLLGHHLQDQHETFLLRLTAGSGPHGLACMYPVTTRKDIQILRPFLHIEPDAIREDLRKRGQSWIEDPSNQDGKYTRVRLRKLLQEEDFDPTTLIQQLQEDRSYFDEAIKEWCSKHVSPQEDGSLRMPHLHNILPSLGKRILRHLIQSLTQASYPVSPTQLDVLWRDITSPSFMGATLGNCHIRRSRGGLQVKKEGPRKGICG